MPTFIWLAPSFNDKIRAHHQHLVSITKGNIVEASLETTFKIGP